MRTIPRLVLRELAVASKPNAWNAAFQENTHAVLVFSDGDVIPEKGAIDALCRLFTGERPDVILAGCSLWPKKSSLSIGQKVVGFLQIPLRQTFLAGGLYAVWREGLKHELLQVGLEGIPVGVVAEDTFLEKLTPVEHFAIIDHKFFYEPPAWADYWKYLARVRWQDEQLTAMYGNLLAADVKRSQSSMGRLAVKMLGGRQPGRLLLGLVGTGMRSIVKMLYSRRIIGHYRALGPIVREGRAILSDASRSRSAK